MEIAGSSAPACVASAALGVAFGAERSCTKVSAKQTAVDLDKRVAKACGLYR